MLYTIFIKASTTSEKELAPNKDLMNQMDQYNDLLQEVGVRVLAKGLYPTKNAIRIQFKDKKKIESKGPFLPTSEQVSGFFLIEVENEEEAVKLFRMCPDPIGNNEGLIELRKIY
jgi:hypothetical protein